MKRFASALGLAATVSAAGNCSSPRLSVQGADTILLRNYASGLRNGAPYVNYEHGVGWRALEMVYNTTSNTKYLDHIKTGANQVVTADGGLNDYDLGYYTLDDIRIGESLIYL